MEWLAIFGLGVWVWLQGRRIQALTRKLEALEQRHPSETSLAKAPAPVPAPVHVEQEPLLLDRPLPPDDREPLLLDTPLPKPSNDTDDTPSPPQPDAEPVQAPALQKPDRRFEQWLAEKGLAWLAGGAFALGAIFLVSFAAQQAWFTPQAQLAAAAALGLVLIGLSEWARRVSLTHPPGHPLVAALLAGAGVVALYASAWASHGVFGFVGEATVLLLLAACALVLIGLSLLHGEAIGVLAIIAALLAPALTGTASPPLLTLALCAMAVTGFLLAALRQWPLVAAATLVGIYFWFAAAIADDAMQRALALLSIASLGGTFAALRPIQAPLREKLGLDWASVRAFGPSIAIAASSVLLLWVWLAAAATPSGRIAGPALIAAFHVALASYAVRARISNHWALAVSIGAAVLGVATYLQARFHFGSLGDDAYPFILAASLIVIVCALTARAHRKGRALTAGAGAFGAALLTALAAASRSDWHALQAWAPLFIGGALLFVAATQTETNAQDPRSDTAVDLWAAAAVAIVLLGIESAVPAVARAPAHAAAALMWAASYRWRGWRILRPASLTIAAVSLAHIASPDLVGASLNGAISIWSALAIIGAAATLLFAAGRAIAEDKQNASWSDALTSAAVIALIAAVFLLLRWVAAGNEHSSLDPISEAALRALALMSAGHVLLPRLTQNLSAIGRWRGHALMGLGMLYAFAAPGLVLNPWWGVEPSLVVGPPLLDTLTLAFATPAALAFAAARRLYNTDHWMARIYAGAGVAFALLWIILEVRRAFHEAEMADAPVGLLEGASYGLVFLGAALAIAVTARVISAMDEQQAAIFSRVARGAGWAGVILGGVMLLLLSHPMWGLHDPNATNALETGLATLSQAAGLTLALLLGRALSASRDLIPARFAAASLSALLAWSFGHAAVRWLAQGEAMDNASPMAGLEGFAHALWPLVFVLAAAEISMRAPGRDTMRAYLHDLQAIWATAIWPALGYATYGLWFYVNPWWGAEAARIASPLAAVLAFLAFLLAGTLSLAAPRVPHMRWPRWSQRAAVLTCLGHLLVAATMVVRWLYHGVEMGAAPAIDMELWSYSATWALFGAAAFGLGLKQSDALLRWSGLAILIGVTVFVFYLTLTRLAGVAQFGSMLGLAVVLMGVAWLARMHRSPSRNRDIA